MLQYMPVRKAYDRDSRTGCISVIAQNNGDCVVSVYRFLCSFFIENKMIIKDTVLDKNNYTGKPCRI